MTLPKLSAHAKAQIGRSIRIFVQAFLAAGGMDMLRGSVHVSRAALIAAASSALEVVYRHFFPVIPVGSSLPSVESKTLPPPAAPHTGAAPNGS